MQKTTMYTESKKQVRKATVAATEIRMCLSAHHVLSHSPVREAGMDVKAKRRVGEVNNTQEDVKCCDRKVFPHPDVPTMMFVNSTGHTSIKENIDI